MNRETARRLSVNVAAVRPGDELARGLCDLAQSQTKPQVEVIFAERVSGAAASCPKAAGGIVRIAVPDTLTLPQLLGRALEHARGEIIAITDTRCEVDERWAAALLRAHEGPHPVIGGAVEPGALRRLVDWAAYLTEYGQFMLPLRAGPAAELPGNNFSMKAWILERGCDFAREEFWKTHWCRRIQADGIQLHLAPEAVLHCRCAYDLWPLLVRRFHHGRCFAGMRLQQVRMLGRLVYIAGAPALPLVLLARMLRAVLPKRRYIGKLALAMPVVCLAILIWAAGELTGYLFGPGRSCRYVR